MKLLELHNISKSYGLTQALKNVDLTVGTGEIMALMGANGAGKSTLVKILCGVQAPDGGTIQLAGRTIAPRSPAEARAAGIIAVHQSIAEVGVPTLPVADNLLLDAYCSGTSPLVVHRRRARAEAQRLADGVGLVVDLDRRLDELSLADRQLVAIARAIAWRPRVILFDEPTASLSADEAERLFRVIENLRAAGTAIVYISHKTADLRRLADRAVVLRDGRLHAEFARPIDFGQAIRSMIGHDLVRRERAAAGEARPPLFSIRGARLRRSPVSFDLDVAPGEILAVTGPVGAGKSSLAGAIFGLWPLEAGTMTLDGQPWRPRGPAHAIEQGVFHAGEDRWRTTFFPSTVPFAQIAGTISFPFLRSWSRAGLAPVAREDAAAEASIARFGIKARDGRAPLNALSGGNQQKVVLARWHAEPSRLLLLDEPFQGVDVGARDDIVRAIRASAGERATIVFVNDVEEALEVGDRIVTMDHHTLLPPDEPALVEAAGSPPPRTTSPDRHPS